MLAEEKRDQIFRVSDPQIISDVAIDELDNLLVGHSIDYETWTKLTRRVHEIVEQEIHLAARHKIVLWLPSEVAVASELAIAELFSRRALIVWIKLCRALGRQVKRHKSLRCSMKWAVQFAIRWGR